MLKKLLDERNNDYCVVGNSPCELGKKQGALIDSHELVLRFNDFSLDGKFSRDYGSKSNVWVRGTNDKLVYTMEKKKLILSDLDLIILRAKDKRNIEFRDYCDENGIIYYILPLENELELTSALNRCPSTGLLILFTIKKILGNIDKDRVFGFSFCKENSKKNPDGKQIHYYNKSDLINPESGKIERIKKTFLISKHNWKREEEYYLKNILGGKSE